MKVAILHHDLEWTEKELLRSFSEKNVFVEGFDVRKIDFEKPEKFADYDVVLNRIYASVANKDQEFHFDKLTTFIQNVEHQGVSVINSSLASKVDYDKFLAYQIMQMNGVRTPKTYVLSSVEETVDFVKNGLGLPFIRKPSLAGRGRGIVKIDNLSEITDELISTQGYPGATLAQVFAESSLSFDYRVCVCSSEILFANTRTLVDGWLGSRSSGSKIKVLKKVPRPVLDLALKASKTIDSYINSLDIVMTSEGPIVIENNPTPNFNIGYIDLFGFNPVDRIVDMIVGDYS